MLEIYAGGKKLKNFGISQSENGVYHKNLKFDNLYSVKGIKQNALDFLITAGNEITLNRDFQILSKMSLPSSESNNAQYVYGKVIGTDKYLFFGHCYKHSSSDIVKAGNAITVVAPVKYNGGFGVHLHIAAHDTYGPYLIRNIIFGIKENNENSQRKQITIQKGWGMSHIAKYAGYDDWGNKEIWNEIANMNGYDNWEKMQEKLEKGIITAGHKVTVKIIKTEEKTIKKTYITVKSGWGISHIAKYSGFNDWLKKSRWNKIAKLNGYGKWEDMQKKLENGTISAGNKVVVKITTA